MEDAFFVLTSFDSSIWLAALATALISYFCGCFNGAVIVSKYILRDDVRKHRVVVQADKFLSYFRRSSDLCGYSDH